MVIELRVDARDSDIAQVRAIVQNEFADVRTVELEERLFLVVSGRRDHIDLPTLKSNSAVVSVSSPDTTAFFCRRSFRSGSTTSIQLGSHKIGGGGLVIIAGPCAVEDIEDLRATAKAVKQAGAHALRAGAFKPRTSPYNFQGLGRRGLDILKEVGSEVGLPIVSEVLDPFDIEFADARVDMHQVGARQMTNQALLKHLGEARKPVLLKRGPFSRLEELVRAAEFITVHGNARIALCERGIQTFETETRNTLDIAVVPALRRMTHLPIVVDPSHAVGRSELVSSVAMAAALVGADALMLEVHVAPDRMVRPGDAAQALTPPVFEKLMADLDKLLRLYGRALG